MGIRRHSWLQLQQVDVGTSVQRHGGNLCAVDQHTILRALRLYLKSIALHIHCVGDGTELQRDVDAKGRIGIDLYPGLLVVAKSGLAGGDVIGVHLEGGQVVKALGIGDCLALDIG
jgi:hypothetical protein